MSFAHSARHEQAGFTLIQVSVLLVVAGLIFVSILPGQNSGNNNTKYLNNVKKLEKIEEATRAFMTLNGRRPCPADGQYRVNTANFGKEAATPGTCTGGTPAAPMGPDTGTSNIVGGVVPTKTLGLSDDYAFDEWGRRFTYVVDKRATKLSTCRTLEGVTLVNTIPLGGTGGIQIESLTGGTLIDSVMYAYISHGPDGHGAFPEQGSTVANRINSGSKDQDQNTNAGASTDGAMTYNTTNFTNVKVMKDKTSTFDDQVWYRQDTKNTCCLGVNCLPQGFRIDGTAVNEGIGWSVAVGDVNGDGIPDLIIGAIGNNSYNNNQGRVYVVFGTKAGFPDPFPLSTLTGANGFRIDWNASSAALLTNDKGNPANENWAEAGFRVYAGDVNGDGYSDIVVGVWQSSMAGLGYYTGSTLVVFGAPTWSRSTYTFDNTAVTGLIDGTKGIRYDSEDPCGGCAPRNLPGAVADVTGDGYADIFLGDAFASPGGNSYAGSIYVILGQKCGGPNVPATYAACSRTWYTVDSDATTGVLGKTPQQAFEIDGTYANQNCCGSLGGIAIGDVNGDGKPDIILSSGTVTGGHTYSTLFIVYGQGGSWPNATNLTADGVAVSSFTAPNYAGWADSTEYPSIGDVNGDGNNDIVFYSTHQISSPTNVGYIWVIFGLSGGSKWATTASLATLNGSGGSPAGSRINLNINDSAGYLGYSTLTVGDVNKDGIADIVLANPDMSPTGLSNAGGVDILFGFSGAWTASFNYPALSGTNGVELDGPVASGLLGYGYTAEPLTLGDLNGDGYNDIIISNAFFTPSEGSEAGETFVFFGRKKYWPGVPYNLGNL
jgi:type II secretory pathway pseudopilin PulG